ncbi:MAG: hemerythrin domain-containing protein [Actinomycetota bacterium]|nr:hemerythrin domain-containing protein [Actinomycetota bacterium]
MADGTDIIAILQNDHNEVRNLLARFDQTAPDRRSDLFRELVSELARHETAEEIIVYPTLRDVAPQGDQIAEARLAEEGQAEQLMAAMEDMDPASTEFVASFRRLRDEVELHASNEELEVFPRLQQQCDAEQRRTLGDRFTTAKGMAPTHPHPEAPDTPPGNILLGPVAAVYDRARDAARRVLGR